MKTSLPLCLLLSLLTINSLLSQDRAPSTKPATALLPPRVSVLTYNIHHAEGVDGRLDLERIAEVIRKSGADVVALQEVDQGVSRSNNVDQPQRLAELLGMQFAFGANIDLQGGKYGNAVLSRFPIRAWKNHMLPNVDGGEQRGVLQVDIELPNQVPLRFLATHFDHRPKSAQRLASAVMINDLFTAAEPHLCMCLAGDLNAIPDSDVLDKIREHWVLPTDQTQATIPVNQPSRKIDYILMKKPAPKTESILSEVESRVIAEAIASDHRPLLSEFEIQNTTKNHPNVLFIAIDDLNDWIGCLQGHPQALTPNIDALARRGMLFTNAHCASPACNPSRAAIFSGRTAHYTGVWSNDSDQLLKQHPDILTIPLAFKQAGYLTLGTGKMLHGMGKDNVKLFDQSFSPEQRWSPFSNQQVRYTAEELPSKGSDNPRHVIPRPNAEPIVLPLNHMPSDRKPDGDDGESFDWGPLDVDDSEMGDTQITNWAIEQLQLGSDDKPFFLGVGYYRPHIPLWAPKRYFEPFPLDGIQLPPYSQDDLNDLSLTGKRWALDAITAGSHASVVKHDQWRAAIQAYLACIHYVDHEIGRLLAAIDASPQRDNTLIILWTDHGWHLGEKQHWGKWTGWERSTRVPLIIVPPQSMANHYAVAGSQCAEPVSLLDLFPTLVELCQVKGPAQLDGQSLLPLLHDPKLATHRTVVTTFDKGNLSLRSVRYRYIRYSDGSEELYDRSSDVNEWYNLASQPQHAPTLQTMRELSQARLQADK